jgi:hypothetical protein
MKALDVGSGSGYLTVCFALMVTFDPYCVHSGPFLHKLKCDQQGDHNFLLDEMNLGGRHKFGPTKQN